MDEWILEALSESAPPDFRADEALKRFAALATDTFMTDSSLQRLSPQDRRASFLINGYVDSEDPPRLVGAFVSNFQDYTAGTDADEAADAFHTYFYREMRPLPDPPVEPEVTMIQRIGAWPASRPADMERLRRVLWSRPPHEKVVEEALTVVREIASRPEAGGTVGEDLSSIVIFRDPERPPTAGYHPLVPEPRTLYRGVSSVVAPGPDLRFMVRDLVLERVDKPTPKVRRNEPCPCGSGRKFKRCCAT
jgi:hypothetical protein